MKPETEEFLYVLLWTTDSLMRPTWRNATDSFENWAWRNGLSRRLAELARQKIIERHPLPDLTRIVRLTEAGRTHALGGRDPVQRWNRSWDGRWRLVLFDLPVIQPELRIRLWRLLRRDHFGCLQGSVWVSPDPPADYFRTSVDVAPVRTDSFLVVEGRPATGESDRHIVEHAWDFGRLTECYQRYLDFIDKPPPAAARLPSWVRRENALWLAAIHQDPLLPRALLPDNYLGLEALQQRKRLFSVLAQTSGMTPTEKM